MAVGAPDFSPRIITSASGDEQLKISVSATDSSGTFTQQVQAVLIYNDGPNAVHFRRGAAATTNNFKIPAKAWISINVPMTTPHFICAASQTATIYVYGVF